MPPLRLRIEDAEDLKIVSAHLQDAIAKVGDFAYEARHRRFAAMFNRYRWEADAAGAPPSRIRSGFHLDGVLKARVRNIRRDDPEAVVELLAIRFEPSGAPEDPGGVVTLDFAGGGTIALEVECLDGHLTDIGQPWLARRRPRHELD